MNNFFREPTLAALRELALREAAHEVGQRIAHRQFDAGDRPEPREQSQSHHRILVFLTADPKTAMVIRRAKRVSDFLEAECFAVAVHPSSKAGGSTSPNWETIQKHLNFARNLHIETRILEDDHAASAVVDFARENQVTQIFVVRPAARPRLLARDPIQKIIDLAKDMQIVIVSDRERATQR